MTNALIFLLDTFSRLYLLILLLRFWLPLLGADFRNPIAQGILSLTSPLVIPLRRIIPPVGRIDTATVLVAFGLQYLTILVILAISGVTASFSSPSTNPSRVRSKGREADCGESFRLEREVSRLKPVTPRG